MASVTINFGDHALGGAVYGCEVDAPVPDGEPSPKFQLYVNGPVPVAEPLKNAVSGDMQKSVWGDVKFGTGFGNTFIYAVLVSKLLQPKLLVTVRVTSCVPGFVKIPLVVAPEPKFPQNQLYVLGPVPPGVLASAKFTVKGEQPLVGLVALKLTTGEG